MTNFEAALMFVTIFAAGAITFVIAYGTFCVVYNIWEKHTKHKPVYFPNWDEEET